MYGRHLKLRKKVVGRIQGDVIRYENWNKWTEKSKDVKSILQQRLLKMGDKIASVLLCDKSVF